MLDLEYNEQFATVDQAEFNRLIAFVLESHCRCDKVIKYFRWDKYGRSGNNKRNLRVSSMLDFSL